VSGSGRGSWEQPVFPPSEWRRLRRWVEEEWPRLLASHPDLVQRLQEGSLFRLPPELREHLIELVGPVPSPKVLAPLGSSPELKDLPDFDADPLVVRTVVEGERLSYAYLFNPTFASEVALIDPLPHQRIAVYEHLLPQPRLRFLLADDAGAGKTIMTGLYIREMLSR
jgi:SNF2 family DNA or RNA helicase